MRQTWSTKNLSNAAMYSLKVITHYRNTFRIKWCINWWGKVVLTLLDDPRVRFYKLLEDINLILKQSSSQIITVLVCKTFFRWHITKNLLLQNIKSFIILLKPYHEYIIKHSEKLLNNRSKLQRFVNLADRMDKYAFDSMLRLLRNQIFKFKINRKF